jgi:Protein of unknown function (DUF2380)
MTCERRRSQGAAFSIASRLLMRATAVLDFHAHSGTVAHNASELRGTIIRMISKTSIVACVSAVLLAATANVAVVRAAEPVKVALLGLEFKNDNEGLDPTSDAEKARQEKTKDVFKSLLEGSGRYTFVAVTDDVKKKMEAGQLVGTCGGCELQYGRDLGVDVVAWIEVQKVSNLILNMNVYMAGVADPKYNYLHSVDIRGNTDETWSRSMTYLIKNYFLAPAEKK